MMLKSGCLFSRLVLHQAGPRINESAMAQALLRKRERADSAILASEAGNFDPSLGTLPGQQRPLFVGPSLQPGVRSLPPAFIEPM